MSRPNASATAMVSEPPLPTCTKTSKGSASSVSLTVMNAVPIGVSLRYVRPERLCGRGLTTDGPMAGTAAGALSLTPTLSTCSPLQPSRKTVMPRQPSSHASL
jgi:hypothetical protein